MIKQLLTATFKNGSKLTRTTDKGYGFAWYSFGHYKDGTAGSNYGFASTEDKARKAAQAVQRYYTHTPCGVEIVKVVATAPAKKVNPAKAKPFRIVSTSDAGKRFMGGRTHLRFATAAEAQIEADRMKADNTARCAVSQYGVPCDYTVTDAKSLKR